MPYLECELECIHLLHKLWTENDWELSFVSKLRAGCSPLSLSFLRVTIRETLVPDVEVLVEVDSACWLFCHNIHHLCAVNVNVHLQEKWLRGSLEWIINSLLSMSH